MSSKKNKKPEQPIFDSIRKPTAPPSKKFGEDKPEEKVHPSQRKTTRQDVWARPEMAVTFRAEIMPGKSRQERTFRIKEVLPNGRVVLYDFVGEHRQSSFEPDRKSV